MLNKRLLLIHIILLAINFLYGRSPSFKTYLNPVIPGDHPDPTLTKIGNYFYTSGSSFNPTPNIYRSTDLVHWQVIAQPVSASWSQYGDNPGGGIWGGHTVLYHDIYYYYSFAQHLVGQQYVMRSDTLTDDESAWTVVGANIFTGPRGNNNTPNHISPAVLLDDGTSWVIGHSYHTSWYAQGRQGLLCQVTYYAQGFPVIQYPSNDAVQAPNLPGGGVPWMVPESDMFNEA